MNDIKRSDISRAEFGMLQEQVNQLERWREGHNVRMDNILDKLDDIFEFIKKYPDDTKSIISACDEKFAGKWVERLVRTSGSVVGEIAMKIVLVVVGIIVGLFFTGKAHAFAYIHNLLFFWV
jgi:hypothetical protein